MGEENKIIKYKFGQDELDLNNYIKNLDRNVERWIESKKSWSDGQKAEFRESYKLYLLGLKDQLAENNNRFSTDGFGVIEDRQGLLSAQDSDSFIYNKKGELFTLKDIADKSERKRNHYKEFNANKLVAEYFYNVGDQIRRKLLLTASKNRSKDLEDTTNYFDISKQGFGNYWSSLYNPSGGESDLTPWLSRETKDDQGNYTTTYRSNLMIEALKGYLDNIKNSENPYDFSKSNYKSFDIFQQRINDAIETLKDGYQPKDALTLQLAGIPLDFVNSYYQTNFDKQDSQGVSLRVLNAATYLSLYNQDLKNEQLIDLANLLDYQRYREQSILNIPKLNKPIYLNLLNQPLAYGRKTILQSIYKNKNITKDTINSLVAQNKLELFNKDLIRDYINFGSLSNIIRGKTVLNNVDPLQHIINNLDLACQYDLLLDPNYTNEGKSLIGDNWWVIPNSEDYTNWTILAFNTVTKEVKEISMVANEQLKLKIFYPSFDKIFKNSYKSKFLYGGSVNIQLEDADYIKNLYNLETESKPDSNGALTQEDKRVPGEDEFNTADKIELASIGGDVLSLIASFAPGWGTAASGILGVASSFAQLGADITRDKADLQDFKNFGVNLGLDAVGLIPGGKTNKTVSRLLKWTPRILTFLAMLDVPEIVSSYNKLISEGVDSLNVLDWRNIGEGIKIATASSLNLRETAAKGKIKKLIETGNYTVKLKDGKTSVSVTPETKEKLQKAKTLEEANTILKLATGDSTAELSNVPKSWYNPGKYIDLKWKGGSPKFEREYDFNKLRDLHKSKEFLFHKNFESPEDKGFKRSLKRFTPETKAKNLIESDLQIKGISRKKTNKEKPVIENKKLTLKLIKSLRAISSKNGPLTSEDIELINTARKLAKKEKLTPKEIESINARKNSTEGSSVLTKLEQQNVSAKLKAKGKTSIEKLEEYKESLVKSKQLKKEADEDIKQAQKELQEATGSVYNRRMKGYNPNSETNLKSKTEGITKEQIQFLRELKKTSLNLLTLGLVAEASRLKKYLESMADNLINVSKAFKPKKRLPSTAVTVVPKANIPNPFRKNPKEETVKKALKELNPRIEKIKRSKKDDKSARKNIQSYRNKYERYAIHHHKKLSSKLKKDIENMYSELFLNLISKDLLIPYTRPLKETLQKFLESQFKPKRSLSGASRTAKEKSLLKVFYKEPKKIRNKKNRSPKYAPKRESGGVLNINLIRKFLEGSKIPEWYDKLYNQKNLSAWNKDLNDSFYNEEELRLHGNADSLQLAYDSNLNYTSSYDNINNDILNYYNSLKTKLSAEDFVKIYNENANKIRSYWTKERSYNEHGASEHNKLFRSMFNSRSLNDNNNPWNIGYLPDLEDILGSSTWLRRMDRYEKEFEDLTPEELKKRTFTVDLGGKKVLVYKKSNGDIALLEKPGVKVKSTFTDRESLGNDNEEGNKKLNLIEFLNKIGTNPNNLGMLRAIYADRINRDITDISNNTYPYVKDHKNFNIKVRNGLDKEILGNQEYLLIIEPFKNPKTSRIEDYLSGRSQAELNGIRLKNVRKSESDAIIRETEKRNENYAKELNDFNYDVNMFNRAQEWGTYHDKQKNELAYLSKKFNIYDTLGLQLEYEAKEKKDHNLNLVDTFAKQEISNAVKYDPNKYGANLSEEESLVWDKIISGIPAYKLSDDELEIYKKAALKIHWAELSQLRNYYHIAPTLWFRANQKNLIEIDKKGSKIVKRDRKIDIDNIRRFSKLIKEGIDRNEKSLEKLSKTLNNIIKSNNIK